MGEMLACPAFHPFPEVDACSLFSFILTTQRMREFYKVLFTFLFLFMGNYY
jgi:hypothetical protein